MEELTTLMQLRLTAMKNSIIFLDIKASGCVYIQQRRYPKSMLFIKERVRGERRGCVPR